MKRTLQPGAERAHGEPASVLLEIRQLFGGPPPLRMATPRDETQQVRAYLDDRLCARRPAEFGDDVPDVPASIVPAQVFIHLWRPRIDAPLRDDVPACDDPPARSAVLRAPAHERFRAP